MGIFVHRDIELHPQYLKNQNELEDYLIEEGVKKLIYEIPKNNNQKDQISNKELISLLKLSKKAQTLVEQLMRRLDNKLVIEQAAVIAALKESSINDPVIGEEIAKYLELRLNVIENNQWKVKYSNSSLIVTKLERGVKKQFIIDTEFLMTPEAKSLNEMRKILMENFGILKNGYAGSLINGDTVYKINGPLNLIEKVFEIGKLGTQINRYKGLGEMNPDQLWETTLDQNYRSLLLVKIEELNDANQIFETLMGDLTDGRKSFIQENSLKVANLDI